MEASRDDASAILATKRRFVDVPGGQVHFREAGAEAGGRPLVMIHASPGSALMLAPLITAMARRGRRVVAPDTVGNGDSAAALPEAPVVADSARLHLAALDAVGLGSFDLYGTHTGASVAAEIAIAAPARVGRLILDGVGLYTPEEQAELVSRYAPEVRPDLHGGHILWAWHFVRDTHMFWPWYRTDAAHRRPTGLPDAATLHAKVVEVLKAIGTYHKSYRAAFAHDKRARLPLLSVPTLLACARDDMLAPMFEELRALVPQAARAWTPGTATPAALEETAAIFAAFLHGATAA